jgi:small multidrug resistance pump
MTGYLPLAVAILAEVIATLFLRSAARSGQPWQWVVVIGGYAAAFALLAFALRTIGVGTAYAIWSGIGTAGVALAGWAIFGERLNAVGGVGIVLIIAGVLLLHLGSAPQPG